MYELVRTNVAGAKTLMEKWVTSLGSMPAEHGLGPRALKSVMMTGRVAKAYLAVVSDQVLTPEAHAAFGEVFLNSGRNQKQSDFVRLFSICARKNAAFKQMESRMVKLASKELEFGPKIVAFTAKLAEPGGVGEDDIAEMIDILPKAKASCRDGATTELAGKLHALMIDKSSNLSAEDERDGLLDELTTCGKQLAALSTDEKASEALQDARKEVSDRLKTLHASTSGRDIIDLAAAVEAGTSSMHVTEEFLAKLNACHGHDMTAAMDALASLKRALHSSLKESMSTLSEDGRTQQCLIILKNLCTIAELTKPTMNVGIVTSMIEKAAGFMDAFKKYRGGASKQNGLSMNKAALAWLSFKLPLEHQSEDYKDLMRSVLTGLMPAMQAHRQFQEERAAASAEAFRAEISEVAPICRGTRDGSCWKEGFQPSTALKDILAAAVVPKTGLLSGPGAKVTGAKQKLQEAPNRACTIDLNLCIAADGIFTVWMFCPS
jgi:hypothetical protein